MESYMRCKLYLTTVEDPVEYQLEGINQIQVQEGIGLTFAHILRSILRQDPDVILVGEIRDLETAEIAIRASLTGHLVLATLHTNDAAGAITRLIDMGTESYLVSSTIRCIISQRLVRTICPNCRESYEVSSDFLKTVGLTISDKVVTLYRGRGCRNCFNSGFKGRTVIAELLQMNDEIRNLAVNKSFTSEITSVAINQGMKSIRQDGLEKVLKGITTLEEVLQVTEDIE